MQRLLILIVLAGLAGCQDQARLADLQGGYASLQQNDCERALAAAERVLAASATAPGAADAQYLRGRAIEQRAKPNDAMAVLDLKTARGAYEEALALAPRPELEPHIHASLGNVCFWLEDYAAASVHCREAADLLEEGDLHAWVLYRAGLCEQRLSKWAAADATFTAVERKYPGTEAARRSVERRGAREYYVQVSAFGTSDAADRFLRILRGQGFPAVRLYRPDRKVYLAMAGPLRDYPQATAMKGRLQIQGYKDAFIVP